MPLNVKAHNHVSHTKFHDGITYNQLYGQKNLTAGFMTISSGCGVPQVNKWGSVGYVTDGTVELHDSTGAHKLAKGDTFHIEQGSTFKWGEASNGTVFWAMEKGASEEITHSIKTTAL